MRLRRNHEKSFSVSRPRLRGVTGAIPVSRSLSIAQSNIQLDVDSLDIRERLVTPRKRGRLTEKELDDTMVDVNIRGHFPFAL